MVTCSFQTILSMSEISLFNNKNATRRHSVESSHRNKIDRHKRTDTKGTASFRRESTKRQMKTVGRHWWICWTIVRVSWAITIRIWKIPPPMLQAIKVIWIVHRCCRKRKRKSVIGIIWWARHWCRIIRIFKIKIRSLLSTIKGKIRNCLNSFRGTIMLERLLNTKIKWTLNRKDSM